MVLDKFLFQAAAMLFSRNKILREKTTKKPIAKYLDLRKGKLLMNFFVIFQFNYCLIIWMYWLRESNNLINKIQERALRIACGDNESNFDAFLEKDSSIPIHQRNIQTLATEAFKTKVS